MASGIDNPVHVTDEENKEFSRTKNDRKSSTDESASKTDKLSKNETDFNIKKLVQRLNANSYASKKSFAQGLLDLGLLAANAAQLKFILTAGESYEFYTLLLTLVITSICLQVIQVVLCLILGIILDINKIDEQRKADIINNVGLSLVVVIVVLNIVISAFDIKSSEYNNKQ